MTALEFYDFIQNSSVQYVDDFTTITVTSAKEHGQESKEFRANKTVLAYHSEYYRAFFSGTGTAMAEKGYPVEKNISFEVFESFLGFCYDRKLPECVYKIKNRIWLKELYTFSIHKMVPFLAEEIRKYISEKTTDKDVDKWLEMQLEVGDEIGASQSLKYIVENFTFGEYTYKYGYDIDDSWIEFLEKTIGLLECRFKGPWQVDNKERLNFLKSCLSYEISDFYRILSLAKKYCPNDFIRVTSGFEGRVDKIPSKKIAPFLCDLSEDDMVVFLDGVGCNTVGKSFAYFK